MNNEGEKFYLSIPNTTDSSEYSSLSDDSDVEVTSTFDETQNELIRTNNDFHLNSDKSTDDDDLEVLNEIKTFDLIMTIIFETILQKMLSWLNSKKRQ